MAQHQMKLMLAAHLAGMLNIQHGGIPLHEEPPNPDDKPKRPATAEDFIHLFTFGLNTDPFYKEEGVEAKEQNFFAQFSLEALEQMRWAIDNNLLTEKGMSGLAPFMNDFDAALRNRRAARKGVAT